MGMAHGASVWMHVRAVLSSRALSLPSQVIKNLILGTITDTKGNVARVRDSHLMYYSTQMSRFATVAEPSIILNNV